MSGKDGHQMKDLLAKAETLTEALPYIKRTWGRRVVIKYGGAAMTDPALREQVASDIVLMKLVGINPVIVHGGGPEITSFMDRLGMKVEFFDGLRVTTEEAMEVVRMVLVGKVNPELVAAINHHGRLAVGVSGDDGNLVTARQRDVRMGRVGDVTAIDTTIIDNLIEDGFVPVVATVAAGEDGGSFNVNADSVASELAVALSADKIIFLTDVDGLYADVDDASTLISALTPVEAEEMIVADKLGGGMVPKVAACVSALRGGVGTGAHPQRHGAPRAAARGLHRRGRRHDDRRRYDWGGVMGAQFDAAVELDSAAIMHTYARKPVLFVRGEGMRLYDEEGREYLDFVSGIGAVNLGHAHPAVTAALAEQAAKLVHVSNLFYVEHRAELAHEVSELARRGMEDVLRELRCRGDRRRDQARTAVGSGAQAGRVQGRHPRAVLPRPHACRARGDRPGLQARRVQAAAGGLRARARQRYRGSRGGCRRHRCGCDDRGHPG